ncbi:iron chaperone [Lewinella sp. W8]|uniref:iron chaperone n=1 Tax=Lewinella sp. W8 TaxID=2528208 RepID=UPI0015672B6E|nr:DUF1801 domain-containing protein [Lewinella sp. W8]
MKPSTVEEYMNQLPEVAQAKAEELRAILKKIAPEADEVLKWGKPAFEMKTILFAYAAHKNHLTFLPTGPAMKPFEEEIAGYAVNKDSIRFQYADPLPVILIEKIAKFRVEDVLERDAKWKY